MKIPHLSYLFDIYTEVYNSQEEKIVEIVKNASKLICYFFLWQNWLTTQEGGGSSGRCTQCPLESDTRWSRNCRWEADTRPEKKDPAMISPGRASCLPGCFSSACVTRMALRILVLGSTSFIRFPAFGTSSSHPLPSCTSLCLPVHKSEPQSAYPS